MAKQYAYHVTYNFSWPLVYFKTKFKIDSETGSGSED